MPAATSVPANTKASFDVSTLFVADQAPAQALASQAKNGGPDFINEIGFPAALKAVRCLPAHLWNLVWWRIEMWRTPRARGEPSSLGSRALICRHHT